MLNKARIREKIGEYELAAQVYWKEGDGFARTAFSLPGMPSATSLDNITPILCDAGLGVFQTQYIGTYDSNGERFTPEGAIKTIELFDEIISRKEVYDLRGERRIHVGDNLDVIAAHSFGTYVAMGAILRHVRPRLGILMSPMFEFGTHSKKVGLAVDWSRHVRHISRALPLTFRIDSRDRWFDFFSHESRFHPTPSDCKPVERKVKVFFVAGDQDRSMKVETNRRYVEEFVSAYDSILEFAGYRTVAGAGHDTAELLTEEIQQEIRELLA